MAISIFKKKDKSKKQGGTKYLQIKEVKTLTKDAVQLIFEQPKGNFDYKPGQFLTIVETVGEEKIRRAYSLCSTPFEDDNPSIAVKRVKEGTMSNHINDHFEAGQTVEIMEPMGMFTTDFDPEREREIVFIGGGSGITPLFSLIRSFLIREPQSKATLIYGNQRESDIMFKSELERLEKENRDRFRVIHILEDNDNGYAFIAGRPSIGIMSDLLTTNNLRNAEFFVCGPQPMMDVVFQSLDMVGIDSEAIHSESFEAGVTSPPADESETRDDSGASEVTIILEGEEHHLKIPKDASILTTALDEGLDMPYSCQSGLCTACRGQCHEGDISTDRVEGLSKEELEEGYRLLCIGQPLTDKIKVEVG